MSVHSDQIGMVGRQSTANTCGWETLDQFITGTAQHRAEHGDDADDFFWWAYDAEGNWMGEPVRGSEV